MGFIKTPEHLTVGTLRKYFDAWEAAWTEQDDKMLGKFEDTPVYCWPSDKGVCKAKIVYDGGLDFIIMEKEDEN